MLYRCFASTSSGDCLSPNPVRTLMLQKRLSHSPIAGRHLSFTAKKPANSHDGLAIWHGSQSIHTNRWHVTIKMLKRNNALLHPYGRDDMGYGSKCPFLHVGASLRHKQLHFQQDDKSHLHWAYQLAAHLFLRTTLKY